MKIGKIILHLAIFYALVGLLMGLVVAHDTQYGNISPLAEWPLIVGPASCKLIQSLYMQHFPKDQIQFTMLTILALCASFAATACMFAGDAVKRKHMAIISAISLIFFFGLYASM
jgi:hypothetical protein